MRLFLALELDERVKDTLSPFLPQLRSLGADLSVVKRENLHLTFYFIGEVDETEAARLAFALSHISFPKFDLSITGMGAFPNPARPRVVWAGCAPESAVRKIGALRTEVCSKLGLSPSSQKFSSHVTLARVRSSRNLSAVGKFLEQNKNAQFGSMTASKVALKQSVLSPSGSIYSDVAVLELI